MYEVPAGSPGRLCYSQRHIEVLEQAFGPLCERSIFTVWRWVHRGEKWTKKPEHPAGKSGVTLAQARLLLSSDASLAGLGVKLGRLKGTESFIYGVDYDGAEKGPLPRSWPKTATYAEKSPSGGDKFHLLAMYEGSLLEGKRRGPLEIYTEDRFFTLTGERLKGGAILSVDPRLFYSAMGFADPQPYVKSSDSNKEKIEPVFSESDLSERERKLLIEVRDVENADLSLRDFLICVRLIQKGATDAEVGNVLRFGFWREKLRRNRGYVERTIRAARKDVGDEAGQGVDAANAPSAAFRNESRAIGDGLPQIDHPPQLFSLSQMLVECIFISKGSEVTMRADPRLAWSFADFENTTAASGHRSGKKGRPTSVAKTWLRNPERQTVHVRTFRAGGALVCQSPSDVKAVNTWRDPPRVAPPADWKSRVKPFLDHIAFLVPITSEREFLLDWLAHIEQEPGVLPHVHVLMVTKKQGIGRNWLGGVLARTWPGVVGLDIDLPQLLDGGFNGRLSHKILAVVNEIREGGGVTAHRHSNRLRSLLTDETRRINPKYGREYDEFNSVRWLMFSNHESALPLDRFDRRIFAIENPEGARGPNYYKEIYRLAADMGFIASVRQLFRARNVRNFNPGMLAPLSATKRKVIEAAMSEPDLRMQDLVANFPVDVITSEALCEQLWEVASRADYASLRHIASRAGAVRYPKRVYRSAHRRQENVWILRNPDKWLQVDAATIEAQLRRTHAHG